MIIIKTKKENVYVNESSFRSITQNKECGVVSIFSNDPNDGIPVVWENVIDVIYTDGSQQYNSSDEDLENMHDIPEKKHNVDFYANKALVDKIGNYKKKFEEIIVSDTKLHRKQIQIQSLFDNFIDSVCQIMEKRNKDYVELNKKEDEMFSAIRKQIENEQTDKLY